MAPEAACVPRFVGHVRVHFGEVDVQRLRRRVGAVLAGGAGGVRRLDGRGAGRRVVREDGTDHRVGGKSTTAKRDV